MAKNTPQPEAINILESYKNIVWKTVSSYLKDPTYPPPFAIPKKYRKEQNLHWEITNEYPTRKGKYLRPTLLILTAEAMGANKDSVIQTASAMQVSEEWLLIHDDFEDHSKERRGKQTLQRIYGPELAVNAGDVLHVIMWKILFDNIPRLGAKKTTEILEEFFRMLLRTTLGQSTEIQWSKEKINHLTDEDWNYIANGKTSYYTIAGPMRLGAMIAGGTIKELDALAKFGSLLGKCFQLVDDILDITSTFEGLKKQTGNDIYEGKQTILLGHLLRTIKIGDKKRLLAILNKEVDKKTPEEVSWVIEKMNQYGSIDYAKSLASKLKKDSETAFERDLSFLSHQPARDKIKTLINFVLERTH